MDDPDIANLAKKLNIDGDLKKDESGTNPYSKMSLKAVEDDARRGIDLAKQELESRKIKEDEVEEDIPEDITTGGIATHTFTSKKGNKYEKKDGVWYDSKGKKVTNTYQVKAAEKGQVKVKEEKVTEKKKPVVIDEVDTTKSPIGKIQVNPPKTPLTTDDVNALTQLEQKMLNDKRNYKDMSETEQGAYARAKLKTKIKVKRINIQRS